MGNNVIFTCTWNILAGKRVIEGVHPVHRSRFSDTCRWTLGNTQSQCFSMGEEIPQNCPLPWVDPGPPSNAWLLGPTAPHMPNAISTEPAVSLGLMLHYPYTSLWDGTFPTPKLPLPVGGSGPPSNIHADCGPPHHTCQTASRSVQPFCHNTSACPTDRLTDRETDRPWTSLAIGRVYMLRIYDAA